MEGAVHQDEFWPQLKVRYVAPDEGGVGLDGQCGQCGRLDVQQDMLAARYHHLDTHTHEEGCGGEEEGGSDEGVMGLDDQGGQFCAGVTQRKKRVPIFIITSRFSVCKRISVIAYTEREPEAR